MNLLPKFGWIFLMSCLCGLAFGGCEEADVAAEGTEADPPVRPAGREPRTEEEWSVFHIIGAIAGFGTLADGHAASPPEVTIRSVADLDGLRKYTIGVNGEDITLNLEAGVWAPETYVETAKRWFRTPEAPASGTSFPTVLEQLLSPTLPTFLSEHERISAEISKSPASVESHLQAALLLGTIGLNDYAGKFKDTRPVLNRMTAHLAIVDALGGEIAASDRALVEAIRMTLCGRQAAALEKLGAVQADASAPYKEWSDLLRLRITNDWRNMKDRARNGSLALRIEYFRTLLDAVDENAAVDFLSELGRISDFSFHWPASEADLSVSGGHKFSRYLLQIGMSEIASMAASLGLPVGEEDFTWLGEYLSIPLGMPVIPREGGGLEASVAGRDLMANLQQRRFMSGLAVMYEFLDDKWGVDDVAHELKDFINKNIPPLPLTPFLLLEIARNDAERASAVEACVEAINSTPSLANAPLWGGVVKMTKNRPALAAKVPDFHGWFSPEVPRGTAYHSGDRLHEIGVGDENDKAWLAELWKRAPYDFRLAWHNAWLENGGTAENMPAEILDRWMGGMKEYYFPAIRKYADIQKPFPEEYEKAMLRMADQVPNTYGTLASYFTDKDEEKAMHYYWLYFEKGTNRVAVANSALWPVRHLYKRGEKEKALQIAEDAADVYSYRGLRAYAWYLEQERRWDEALEVARKIDERYNESPVEVVRFALSRIAEDPNAPEREALKQDIEKIFPKGFQPVSLAEFSGPPKRGAVFTSSSAALRKFGLDKGMVVVAAYGIRVESCDQYEVTKQMYDKPDLDLIYWDGKEYREKTVHLPTKRFGVRMEDYSAE